MAEHWFYQTKKEKKRTSKHNEAQNFLLYLYSMRVVFTAGSVTITVHVKSYQIRCDVKLTVRRSKLYTHTKNSYSNTVFVNFLSIFVSRLNTTRREQKENIYISEYVEKIVWQREEEKSSMEQQKLKEERIEASLAKRSMEIYYFPVYWRRPLRKSTCLVLAIIFKGKQSPPESLYC